MFFLILVVVLFVVLILTVVLLPILVNQLRPFKKMNKKELNDCYPINQEVTYKNK